MARQTSNVKNRRARLAEARKLVRALARHADAQDDDGDDDEDDRTSRTSK